MLRVIGFVAGVAWEATQPIVAVQVGVKVLASVKSSITLRAGMRLCARVTHLVPSQNGLAMEGSSTLFTHMLALLLEGTCTLNLTMSSIKYKV